MARLTLFRNHRRLARILCLLTPPLLLAGCGSMQPQPVAHDNSVATPVASVKKTPLPALPPAGSGRGGYYQDDGPGEQTPDNLLATPDAEPKIEPYASRGNKPYKVFGKTYVPILDERPFKQRGIGSWYGKKFHGQKTSSGEPYNMYQMTAAHPTLPIPSYARVTNLANGKQVIVRINDRGPFHAGRIIDLSYTAALKLGYLARGSSELEVERLLPDEIARMQRMRQSTDVALQAPASSTDAAQSAVVAAPVEERAGKPAVAAATTPASANQAGLQPDTQERATTVAPVAYAVPATPRITTEAPPGTAAGAGFYLQLGAFGQAANAEAARTRLQENAAGTLMPVNVVASNGLYRLYSGPYASRDEAQAAAQTMQQGGAAKPMIVQK